MEGKQIVTLIFLVAFVAIMVGIGLLSMKRTKTVGGFLLGGRKMGAWMSAFAYGTSYFSAVLFIGYAGKNGWNIGISSMDWDWKCNLRKFSGVENTRQADKAHDPSPGRQDDAGIL
ncbi:MAG: hypothetical protein ACLTDS_07875 [Bianqueaceae bacterium]